MLRKKGFTIVEVALVLGIAGLIFMMVFIALPTLQRNQRDAQRREDMIILGDAIKKFQSSNRGTLPSISNSVIKGSDVRNGNYNGNEFSKTWEGLYRDYLEKTFVDPSGNNYNFYVATCTKTASGTCSQRDTWNSSYKNKQYILIVAGATCDGEKVMWSSNPRHVAIEYKLEGGGIYCGDL